MVVVERLLRLFLRLLLVIRGKSELKWLNYIGMDLLVSSYCACDLLLSVYLLFVDACVFVLVSSR